MVYYFGLFALPIVVLSALVPLVLCESVRVNLVEPVFQGAYINNIGPPQAQVISFTLYTRSNKYEVQLNKSQSVLGEIRRTSDWREPGNVLEEEDYFTPSGKKPKAGILEKARTYMLNYNASVSLVNASRPAWFKPHAQCTFNLLNRTREITISAALVDNQLQVCKYAAGETEVCTLEVIDFLYSLDTTYMPISAMAAAANETDFVEIYFFDVLGRMWITHWKLTDKPFINLTSLHEKDNFKPELISFSSIDTPFSSSTSPKMNDLMKSKPELKKSLTKNYDKKIRGSYVQTITPIFGIDTEPDMTPLCVVNGYKLKGLNSQLPIFCQHKDKDQSKYIPRMVSNRDLIIYSANIMLDKAKNMSFFHFIYSFAPAKTNDEGFKPALVRYHYLFTARSSFAQGTTSQDEYIVFGDPTEVGINKIVEISFIPQDIVSFNDGKCARTIAFYDRLYTLHAPNERIHEPKEPLLSKSLDFQINAAMVLKNKFYFFTYVNTLIIMDGSFEGYCDSLKFSNPVEMYSDDFLLPILIDMKRDFIPPHILDYRELKEGANDTSPSVVGKQDKPTPPKSGSSNVIVIVIGLILGGLILAGLLYIFCLRSSDTEVATLTVKSKSKRRKTPEAAADALHAVTVRSGTAQSPASTPELKQSSKIRSMGAPQPLKASTDIKQSSKISSSGLKAKTPLAGATKKIESSTSKKSLANKSPFGNPKSKSIKLGRSPSARSNKSNKSPILSKNKSSSSKMSSTKKKSPMGEVKSVKIIAK